MTSSKEDRRNDRKPFYHNEFLHNTLMFMKVGPVGFEPTTKGL